MVESRPTPSSSGTTLPGRVAYNFGQVLRLPVADDLGKFLHAHLFRVELQAFHLIVPAAAWEEFCERYATRIHAAELVITFVSDVVAAAMKDPYANRIYLNLGRTVQHLHCELRREQPINSPCVIDGVRARVHIVKASVLFKLLLLFSPLAAVLLHVGVVLEEC